MAVKVPNAIKEEIVAAFENKVTIGEIATRYGYSTSTVSRMLADAGVHTLSNYKTKEEARMCELLHIKGIRTAADLAKVLRERTT